MHGGILYCIVYSIPVSVQGQVGRALEQPGIVEGVPAPAVGLDLDGLYSPFQPKPFYGSMIL